MVDGVMASCYPSVNHDLGHISMLPIQYFPRIMELIFGEDNGFSEYSNIANHLGGWMLPDNSFMKIN